MNYACVSESLTSYTASIFEVSQNSSDSIKLIELILKTTIDSLEWAFLLPILFLLYIVLLLLVTANKFIKVTTHGKQTTVMFIYDTQ